MFSGGELFPVIIALMMNSLMPLTQLPRAGGTKIICSKKQKIVDNRKGVLVTTLDCCWSALVIFCFFPTFPIIRWNHAQRQADKPTGVSLR